MKGLLKEIRSCKVDRAFMVRGVKMEHEFPDIEVLLENSYKVGEAGKLFHEAQGVDIKAAIAKYKEATRLLREAIPNLKDSNWLGRAYCLLADCLYRQPMKTPFDFEDAMRRTKEALVFFELAYPILYHFGETKWGDYAQDMAKQIKKEKS